MSTSSLPTLRMMKTCPGTSSEGPRPSSIRLHRQSRRLELVYGNACSLQLSAEYLRVFSPSAELQGHGPGGARLVVGKEQVAVTAVQPQGHYAIRLIFDDGHDSGIYTWSLLKSLADKYEANWQNYLERVHKASADALAGNAIASSSHPRVEIYNSD